MTDIVKQFKAVLEFGDVLTGEDVSSRSAGIWGDPGPIRAKAIVRPKTTDEVSSVMKICHAENQTVVTHGGLSGVVNGALASESDIVLSLELMNRIEEIDVVGRTTTVQAGVILQTLQQEAQKSGLLFPLDLGARGSCMIGGNVATNAGGNRVIRYGMARDLVLGLEVVLADGTVISSLNKMIKNNAGYDSKHLFIGSEGTLGVITRVVLRLQEQPRSHNIALVALNRFEKVISLLKFMDAALGGTLSAFEVMWKDFYQLVTTAPAPSQPPLSHDHPFYVLLESLGAHQEDDTSRFQSALERAFEDELIANAVVGQSQSERDAMWEMRDDVAQALRFQPLFLFDVSLAIKEMQGYVEQVQRDLKSEWPDHHCFVFGHLGDGNLHFMISAGSDDLHTRRKVEEIVYKPLMKVNGSVSAEHGIGLDKKPYLSWCRSEAEISLMRNLKQMLDPKGIWNPGKIFD